MRLLLMILIILCGCAKENPISTLILFEREVTVPSDSGVYIFTIVDNNGKVYQYVGKAKSNFNRRLNDYNTNLDNLRYGRPPRNKQRFRGVHAAIYKAYRSNWDIVVTLIPSTPDKVADFERSIIDKLKPNLNRKGFEEVNSEF